MIKNYFEKYDPNMKPGIFTYCSSAECERKDCQRHQEHYVEGYVEVNFKNICTNYKEVQK